VSVKEVLAKVFGELKPYQMDFYSEVEGEVLQSSQQDYGQITYFYVFTVEPDEDESKGHRFSVDLWYYTIGLLMSPRIPSLQREFKTEEDAKFVNSQGDAWIKGLL
jgi:hypothetical protein